MIILLFVFSLLTFVNILVIDLIYISDFLRKVSCATNNTSQMIYLRYLSEAALCTRCLCFLSTCAA